MGRLDWRLFDFTKEVVMVTASQLVAHAVGDYLLQSDWMAMEKRKSAFVASLHAATYSIPFLFLGVSFPALLFIGITHMFIDHFGLARYVVFAKNFLAPRSQWPVWERCKGNGYDESRPPWLSTWLFIIADNIMHVLCNALAIAYL